MLTSNDNLERVNGVRVGSRTNADAEKAKGRLEEKKKETGRTK